MKNVHFAAPWTLPTGAAAPQPQHPPPTYALVHNMYVGLIFVQNYEYYCIWGVTR